MKMSVGTTPRHKNMEQNLRPPPSLHDNSAKQVIKNAWTAAVIGRHVSFLATATKWSLKTFLKEAKKSGRDSGDEESLAPPLMAAPENRLEESSFSRMAQSDLRLSFGSTFAVR